MPAYLMHDELFVTGFRELVDDLEVSFGIGATRNGLRHVVLRDHLGGLFEVRRSRQFLPELALDRDIGPPFMGDLAHLRLIVPIANVELGYPRLPRPSGLVELLDGGRLGCHAVRPSPMRPARVAALFPLAATGALALLSIQGW